MVTGVEIAGGFASLKAVKDLLKGAYDAKVDADVKAKVYEAMERLGSALDTMQDLRAANYELLEANNALKQQIADARVWADKIAPYKLTKTAGGAVVYKFDGEPSHYACPSCFNKRELHILQDNRTFRGLYRCTGCEETFPVDVSQSGTSTVRT